MLWRSSGLVNDLPSQDFLSGPFPSAIFDTLFSTEGRAELEGRAGGPVAQNLGRIYSLDVDEITYLDSLGVDAAGLLAAMNAQTDIVAPRPSREYIERYADFTGKIKGPVLTIHTKFDGLAILNNESAYKETVEAAGDGALLVQAFTNGIGHCAFTPEQLFAAVEAMDYWLETGNPQARRPSRKPWDLTTATSRCPGRTRTEARGVHPPGFEGNRPGTATRRSGRDLLLLHAPGRRTLRAKCQGQKPTLRAEVSRLARVPVVTAGR